MMILKYRLISGLNSFRNFPPGKRNTLVSVEMRQNNTKKGHSGASHTFNSDGTKVLDRGVWKEYKYCKNCKKIMVIRKSWEKNWDSVAVCSDKCRKAARSKKDSTSE
jgi:hypothetical protein